jgi:hypothetical protein
MADQLVQVRCDGGFACCVHECVAALTGLDTLFVAGVEARSPARDGEQIMRCRSNSSVLVIGGYHRGFRGVSIWLGLAK